VKLDLYARAGIGEYWIINLNDRVLEVYRQPVDGGTAGGVPGAPGTAARPDVAPLAFPDVEIALRDIFPEEEAD
jgi:Uma2 family endonuclease